MDERIEPPVRRNTKPLPNLARKEWLTHPRRLILWACISGVLLIGAIVGGVYLFKQGSLLGGLISPSLTLPPSLGDLATQYPQFASVLQNSELDSVYKEFFLAYQKDGAQAALELARKRGLLNTRDELRLTLELDTTDTDLLQSQLEAGGILVTTVSGNLMDLAIPMSLIEQIMKSSDPASLFSGLTELDHVTRVRLPRVYSPSARDNGQETLPVIGADKWHQAGFTGKGIKIGVLDLGFNGYKDLLGTELPETVTARSFIAGTEIDQAPTEHGAAVAEVVHDVAPEADLYFAAYQTDAEQRQAVDWLLAQGVKIINHSAGSQYGPMDGSGPGAQLVDQVVEGGVLWVNASGNSGDGHYRGTFTDKDNDGLHEFAKSKETMGFNPDGFTSITLNWDDWTNQTEDYSLLVFDNNGNLIASSENAQNGPGSDAAEEVRYNFPDSGPYWVAFRAEHVTRPAVFDFYIHTAALQYVTPEYSITTPADARRALTVGATYWSTDEIEPFSSQGPTHDGRVKPDISAPDGMSSTTYSKNGFSGTSASSPHVAGAAALVLQAHPEFGPNDIIAFLEGRAQDLGKSGSDPVFGYGRLWLGDRPALGVEPTLQAGVTATLPPLAVVTRLPTSKPKRTSTPKPDTGHTSASSSSYLLGAGCVIGLGALGLGGIGLVAVVWLRGRRPTPIPPPVTPSYYYPPTPASPMTPSNYQFPSPGPGPQTPARTPAAMPGYLPSQVGSIPPLPRPVAAPTDLCPRCRQPHRPQARFCASCGYTLSPAPPPPAVQASVRCVYCGQALRTNSKFCPKCGKRR